MFPHVPFPGDHQTFLDAAAIGREIRAVETFARRPGAAFLPADLGRLDTPPSAGPLGPVDWRDGRFALRRDGSGKVTGVPEPIWRFQVSGYRLLPRWLAARERQPVDKALITAMRDVAGRIAELIHWFDVADLVLTRALAHTVTRVELGLAPSPVAASGSGEQADNQMTDLFGHTAAQGSLFGEAPNRIPDSPSDTRSYLPDPADVRRRLQDLLTTARGAERMPWDARKAGLWRIVFPQMANWLPSEEADQLRKAFAAEMERLTEAT